MRNRKSRSPKSLSPDAPSGAAGGAAGSVAGILPARGDGSVAGILPARNAGVSPACCVVGRVGEFIDSQELLPAADAGVGARVLVAVSGGMDSVAMLEILRRLACEPARGYRLVVAHLNHMIRPGADEDARFVADLAGRHGLEAVIEREDVPAFARANRLGIEEAARTLRYRFLQRAAAGCACAAVAVAHHQDDNVETVLHRIIRGTHLQGLAGMAARRTLERGLAPFSSLENGACPRFSGETGLRSAVCGSAKKRGLAPANDAGASPLSASPLPGGPVLVRPLLCLTRGQIEGFCREARLTWRTDQSNADVSYRRNFIRHEVLPMLRRELNPGVDEAIARLAQSARQVEEYLAGAAGEVLRRAIVRQSAGEIVLDAAVVAPAGQLICSYIPRLVLERLGARMQDVGAEHLRQAACVLGGTLGSVNLPGCWRLRRDGLEITCQSLAGRTQAAQGRPQEVVQIAIPGRTGLPGGHSIDVRIEPFAPAAFELHRRSAASQKKVDGPGCGLYVEILDGDKISLPLVCRPRKAGDKFRPLGGRGSQSVSDFLTNLKLPPAQRRRVMCLCDQSGIVCLWPLRIADRVKVTPRTRQMIVVTGDGTVTDVGY